MARRARVSLVLIIANLLVACWCLWISQGFQKMAHQKHQEAIKREAARLRQEEERKNSWRAWIGRMEMRVASYTVASSGLLALWRCSPYVMATAGAPGMLFLGGVVVTIACSFLIPPEEAKYKAPPLPGEREEIWARRTQVALFAYATDTFLSCVFIPCLAFCAQLRSRISYYGHIAAGSMLLLVVLGLMFCCVDEPPLLLCLCGMICVECCLDVSGFGSLGGAELKLRMAFEVADLKLLASGP